MSAVKHCRVAVRLSTDPAVPLVAQQGRLYAARLVGSDPVGATTNVGCVLYDSATAPAGDVILALAAGGIAPDDWPGQAISVNFQHGLWPKFTTGSAFLLVYWERQ